MDQFCTTPDGRRPLPMLLSKLAVRFTAEFDRRLVEEEFCSLRLTHSSNVLRFLRRGPQRASQLVAMGAVTKQALSQQIAHLERTGFIELTPDPCDQRARMVSLTDKGRRAQDRIDRLFAEIESDWARTLGERDAASLRRILEKGMDRLGATEPVRAVPVA